MRCDDMASRGKESSAFSVSNCENLKRQGNTCSMAIIAICRAPFFTPACGDARIIHEQV